MLCGSSCSGPPRTPFDPAGAVRGAVLAVVLGRTSAPSARIVTVRMRLGSLAGLAVGVAVPAGAGGCAWATTGGVDIGGVVLDGIEAVLVGHAGGMPENASGGVGVRKGTGCSSRGT